ncbi:MAG: aminotransferase class I/II-fold pyridoxal phosphate-dependent enzyme [Acutalibacteraceae bacterium]|nr:aminotransferase class I/II-fold pyridoxal phosphate-dependent enzyme [Acutalibacteraceae bacterium]
MNLYQYLKEYSKEIYPMHMPGHKRNFSIVGETPLKEIDVTEVEGTDDLHDPEGIILKSMEKTAELYGSYFCRYVVNGSTCGILSSIYAFTERGDRVLVARNCHKSVYNAINICGLLPVYVTPEYDGEFSINGSISPQLVEKALNEYPDIKLCVLTSLTYEGVVSDISAISKILHKKNIPLVVDEAHGAHLGFSEYFPKGAIKSGADCVIHSTHKTLPCLTQTAAVHICKSLWEGEELQEACRKLTEALGIFETSSPSYVLMSSIDQCMNYLSENSAKAFESYKNMLEDFSEKAKDLKHIKILCKGNDRKENHKSFYDFDSGKLVISLKNTSLGGAEFEKILREKYKIQTEMTSLNYCVAMTSFCDSEKGFERLFDALSNIDREYGAENIFINENTMGGKIIEPPVSIYEARKCQKEYVSLEEAEGKICGEYVFAYPPGIPIFAPGELITKELTEKIKSLYKAKINLKSSGGNIPEKILVLK